MALEKIEVELLEVLSSTKWKATLELRKEILRLRYKRPLLTAQLLGLRLPEQYFDLLFGPSYGNLYATICIFEKWRWVESRWREEPPEELRLRGGNRRREYRLTKDGLRIKNETPSTETADSGSFASA